MNVLFNLFDEFLSRANEKAEDFCDFCSMVGEEIVFPLFNGLLWVLLFFTLPIWIIPFLIMKKRREENKNAD